MTSRGIEIGPSAIGVLFAIYSPNMSEGEILRQLKNLLPHYVLLHRKMHELERLVM